MTTKARPRLGRGLSGLISISDDSAGDLPEVSQAGDMPFVNPLPPVVPAHTPVVHRSVVPPEWVAAEVEAAKASSRVLEIPLDQIVPNPHQPRRQMNEAAIAELAASLKSTGLIQPVIVKKSGEQFELIAGERRWRAAKVAGLTTVPAIVREASSFEQAQMALVENIQRENLNPIDRAQAYRTLMTQLGLTQAELANRTGEDRSSVANFLRLLDLDVSVQAMVVSEQLSMGHAKILAGVTDQADQIRLAELVVGQSLSVRNLERQLQRPTAPAARSAPAVSPHLIDLEKSLSQQLGMRVQVKSAAQKGHGKLVLHYASLDQFDDLVNRLGAKLES
jgi:ParB family chromosome partitioning protein